MEDRNIQSMPQQNQIENNKPSVAKTGGYITGKIGCSMNGGHNKVIHWDYVMAGQHINKGVLNLNIQMLTPKTPAFQRLRAKAMLVYVPHERVWKKYIDYIAQRGGNSVEKLTKKPNYGGKLIPTVLGTGTNTTITTITNTTAWRDHWISAYIPKIGFSYTQPTSSGIPSNWRVMPEYDALPARAYIAIYNDILRNKEYEAPLNEYVDLDTVTDAEWEAIMPFPGNQIIQPNNTIDVQQSRCRRNTSYYTDYRTELQGLDIDAPDTTDGEQALLQWANFEAKIDLARQNAENAQLRDIDILAKIRGSKKLTQSRVQVLAEKTFDINYSAITQSAYNTNEAIEEKFQVMGQQGAYSYTNIGLPLGEDIMFLSDGTIHVILTVTADSIFETGLYRRALNVNALDEYRPELEDDKLDVIYECEFGTEYFMNEGNEAQPNYKKIRGYKRRFNEYFKGNNVIQGDMTTRQLYQVENGGTTTEWILGDNIIKLETNHTYQFFETSGEIATIYNGSSYLSWNKKPWYDYTDLQINDNQAILNEVGRSADYDTEGNSFYIKGQNQLFMVGTYTIETTIPVSDKIKNNYTEWGEH